MAFLERKSGFNRKNVVLLLLVALSISSCKRSASSFDPQQRGLFITGFGGGPIDIPHRNQDVAYDLDPELESYLLYVPAAYTGNQPYGLIVFTSADDNMTGLPFGWQSILDTRRYIFVAAQNAGNDQERRRRLGLAVLAAMKIIKQYRIDRSRVFAAGFSGGARMAGLLGFYHSDIFHGTLQDCGADFYRAVPVMAATSQVDSEGYPYGVFQASTDDIIRARSVRFALITGTNDFRRGNIMDIFNGGFARDGFNARLFDIPGMGHALCDSKTLARVLDFLEGSPPN